MIIFFIARFQIPKLFLITNLNILAIILWPEKKVTAKFRDIITGHSATYHKKKPEQPAPAFFKSLKIKPTA